MSNANANEYTYVLRTCNSKLRSHDGDFQWPKSGRVKCNDWKPTPECGNGLHGLLMGVGDGNLLNWDVNAKWLVVKVLASDVIVIDGDKVKFPKGNVVYCGDRKGATDYIIAKGADASKVVGAVITVGDNASAVGGNYTTVSGGDDANVSGGRGATVSGGNYATVSGGNGANVSGGWRATVSGGNNATVSGGDYATVSGGDGSILQVKWYDDKRYRIAVAYVGEDGIEANVKYKVNDEGKFVKA